MQGTHHQKGWTYLSIGMQGTWHLKSSPAGIWNFPRLKAILYPGLPDTLWGGMTGLFCEDYSVLIVFVWMMQCFISGVKLLHWEPDLLALEFLRPLYMVLWANKSRTLADLFCGLVYVHRDMKIGNVLCLVTWETWQTFREAAHLQGNVPHFCRKPEGYLRGSSLDSVRSDRFSGLDALELRAVKEALLLGDEVSGRRNGPNSSIYKLESSSIFSIRTHP